MAKVKPFCGIRPAAHLTQRIASRPYDVLSSAEAQVEASGNPYSLYHIIKPEIDFTPIADEHAPHVYEKAKENYLMFKTNQWLVRDDAEHYYLYAQRMGEHIQYGIVVAASVDDYMSGRIKKHELTRRDKEEDRMKHVRINRANIEPVFLSFPDDDILQRIIDQTATSEPDYIFTAPDGFGHTFWTISDAATIQSITEAFAGIEHLYIADGHHRTAAAALVGNEMAKANPTHTGQEEYNYFLAVAFPASHLKIMDYNRLVRDLNGLTPDTLLEHLAQNFTITPKGCKPYRPTRLHDIALYVDHNWYSLQPLEGRVDDSDPIGILDVTVTSNLILRDILGITDLRTDHRIDFVGGIRGLDELQRRVDSGEMALALALHPVSMEQLIAIADSGNIMPPKTTWFEPKLRSGLIIHELDS